MHPPGEAQVHRRLQVRRDVEGGAHEREVRERLRKVPKHALRLGVVLLGEQVEVVGEADETSEELQSLLVPTEQLVAVGEPE